MIGSIVFFSVGLIFLVSGAISLAEGTYGPAPLIIGILCIVFSLISGGYKFYKNMRRRESEMLRREAFHKYLAENNFLITKRLCNFILDSTSKRWCIDLNPQIFDFTEIESATVIKNSSRTWTTSSTSRGNSRKTSNITNTYDVMIKTTNIDCPVITISCDDSLATAEEICTTIKIIKKEDKKQ